MRKQNVIHVIANCRDCDWTSEDIETAQDAAKKHSQKHGHYVSVEVGLAVTYDYRTSAKPKRGPA